jgi:hypothetical protein
MQPIEIGFALNSRDSLLKIVPTTEPTTIHATVRLSVNCLASCPLLAESCLARSQGLQRAWTTSGSSSAFFSSSTVSALVACGAIGCSRSAST